MILFIFIFVIIFVLLCRKLTYHPVDYKLHLFVGKKGSGKSSFIAKTSLWAYRHGVTCYTVAIDVPGCIPIDKNDIGSTKFVPNSILFIDEVGTIFNNRDFKSFKREWRDFFKFQRHYRMTVYMFSQSPTDADKTLRDLCDYLYIVKRLGKFSFYREVNKSIGIGTDQEGNGSIVENYQYSDPISGILFNGYMLVYLPRYYGLFDSYSTVDLPEIIGTPLPFTSDQLQQINTRDYILFKLRNMYNYILVSFRSSRLSRIPEWFMRERN